jgi:hypothetical protein
MTPLALTNADSSKIVPSFHPASNIELFLLNLRCPHLTAGGSHVEPSRQYPGGGRDKALITADTLDDPRERESGNASICGVVDPASRTRTDASRQHLIQRKSLPLTAYSYPWSSFRIRRVASGGQGSSSAITRTCELSAMLIRT